MALLHLDFYSDVLGRGAHMDAILPEKSSSPRWKTLYLLHDTTGDGSSWQRFTSVERYAQERELAVILPDGDLRWDADTPWGESDCEFISQELIQLTRRMFPRLSHERADTFVAGCDLGGCDALRCALKHPETFSKAASLSGAAGPGAENELFAAARACGENRPELWLWCGAEDFNDDMNLRMRDRLRNLGFSLDYSEGSGGHPWACWDRELPRMLDWLLGGEAKACR